MASDDTRTWAKSTKKFIWLLAVTVIPGFSVILITPFVDNSIKYILVKIAIGCVGGFMSFMGFALYYLMRNFSRDLKLLLKASATGARWSDPDEVSMLLMTTRVFT